MVQTKSKTLRVSPAQEMKILRAIVEITNAELNITVALKEVVKIVAEMAKADSVFIYLLDQDTQHLVLMASKSAHKEEVGKINLEVGEGITGWVAQQLTPVAINENAYQDPRFKRFDVLPEDKFEAFLSVPILQKRSVVGVINVQHKKPHVYDETAVTLLSLIAKQVVGVIEQARLYEEMKKKAAQFDALVKVSQSITSEDYLDEILGLIVVVTAEMLNSKICSIMLLDDKGQELAIKATQSLSEAYTKKPNVKVSHSVGGEVVRSKKPIAIYDVRKDSRYCFRDVAVKEDLTSMLAVPMVVKDKAIGIITVYTKKPHSFVKEEIDALQMVANQAAVAVENTKLMDAALRAQEALETRKLVERAKGVLMRLSGLKEEEAYRMIHKKSMDSCRSMRDVAESILLMDELQQGKKKV